MRKILLIVLLLFGLLQGFTQPRLPDKDQVLERIALLQESGDGEYHKGMFPSKRFFNNPANAKEDNNIFFTALITFTLQSYRDAFDAEGKKIIDTLINRAMKNYPRYSNRQGDVTFNFWQTHPNSPLPNSFILSKIDHFNLADDFDDTSIIFLTQEPNDSTEQRLRKKMANHVNTGGMKTTLKRYRDRQAYSTWFGSKMKDFDICVLANTLLFVADRGFELNKYDLASYRLIEQMILNRDHCLIPHIASPHYQSSAIILYHMARLAAKPGNHLSPFIIRQVIDDIQNQLKNTKNRMEKILLLSSLARLNVNSNHQIRFEHIADSFRDFDFFVANFFSIHHVTLKRMLGKSKFLHFHYQCEAYNWALILEYLVLKEEMQSN